MLHSTVQQRGFRHIGPRVERQLQRYDPRTTSNAGLWVKSARSSPKFCSESAGSVPESRSECTKTGPKSMMVGNPSLSTVTP